jgi:hypothetical protein
MHVQNLQGAGGWSGDVSGTPKPDSLRHPAQQFKFSLAIPASLPVEAEERSKEKLLVATALVKEVGFIGDSSPLVQNDFHRHQTWSCFSLASSCLESKMIRRFTLFA